MKRVVVLGAGMVGGAIAADLSGEYRVTSVDRDGERLAALAARWPLQTEVADAGNASAVGRIVAGADLVIGAVPGFMGYRTLEVVIRAGKPVVDISFFPEDPFGLDELARSKGVTAVVDCGVAPGLSNIILGYHAARGEVNTYRCLVGGLPQDRSWPWQYKAPFSPVDVLEEYTRPARIVRDGEVVTLPALSEPELVDMGQAGQLEAFNTDGLRSLIATMRVPNMIEKTLRYPGHIEYVRVLKKSGFLSGEPVVVDGVRVRPIDMTAALLFKQWRLEPGEPEFTVMEVVVSGSEGVCRYHLFDETDRVTGFSSMARTTGYTCTAAARLVLEGKFERAGICPPEYLGAEPGCFEAIVQALADRGVLLR